MRWTAPASNSARVTPLAEAGMAVMRKLFKDTGSEFHMGIGGAGTTERKAR